MGLGVFGRLDLLPLFFVFLGAMLLPDVLPSSGCVRRRPTRYGLPGEFVPLRYGWWARR